MYRRPPELMMNMRVCLRRLSRMRSFMFLFYTLQFSDFLTYQINFNRYYFFVGQIMAWTNRRMKVYITKRKKYTVLNQVHLTVHIHQPSRILQGRCSRFNFHPTPAAVDNVNLGSFHE